jgi:hypothetical protein
VTPDLLVPRDPGPPLDVDGVGEWHRAVVASLFQFGLVAAGLVSAEVSRRWWTEATCRVCGCGGPSDVACWYCPPVKLEEAV